LPNRAASHIVSPDVPDAGYRPARRPSEIRADARPGGHGEEDAMSFGDYLKRGWEVVRLKTEAIDALAQDEKAFGPAVGVVALSGLCWAIGTLQPWGIILWPIARVIGFFIFIGIIHLAATAIFGGKGEFRALFNPIGCAVLVTWVAIIPILGIPLGVLAGLWLLVPSVLTVERLYGIDRTKAIISVLIPVILAIIVWSLIGIGALLGGLLLSR
jgi:hypothetical protein